MERHAGSWGIAGWIVLGNLLIAGRENDASSRQSFPSSRTIGQEEEARTVLRNSLMIMIVQCLLLAHPATATLTLYTTEAAWLAATINVEEFDTTSDNIALSNEIASVPGGNADLGSILTFDAPNTGLAWSFSLKSLNVPANLARGLVHDDSEAGLAGPRNISIGDADGTGNENTRSLYENDDWQVDILSGPDLTAFAFTLIGNDESVAESLQVFSGQTLLGTINDVLTVGINGTRFFGVVTTEPITHIVFDEDDVDPGPNFDDIAIRDFRFGEVAPTAVESATWTGIKALFR
jgi:hypothetical protein